MKPHLYCLLTMICATAISVTPAFAEGTLTLVGPTSVARGETFTVDVFVQADPEVLFRGYLLTMPCSASGGDAGTIDVGPLPVIDCGLLNRVEIGAHSTVTLFARFGGWSMSVPFMSAT